MQPDVKIENSSGLKKLKLFFADWRNQLHNVRWVAKFARPQAKRLLLVSILSCVISAMSIVASFLVKELVDTADNGITGVGLFVFYSGVVISSMLIGSLSNYLSTLFYERSNIALRSRIFSSILHAQWLSISEYPSGDLLTRMTSDADRVSDGVVNVLPDLLAAFVQLFLTLLVLLLYSPAVALLAIAFGIVGSLVNMLLKRSLFSIQQKVQEAESKYRSFLQESCNNINIFKGFSQEDAAIDRLCELHSNRMYHLKKRLKVNYSTSLTLNFAYNMCYFVAFGWCVWQLSSHSISYGTLTLFLTLTAYIQRPIIGIVASVPQVIWLLTSAGRIMELESIKSEPTGELIHPTQYAVGIKAEGLSFSYSNDELILNDVTFSIKPGEFVAIVGESGSGKTTLLRLLMAFVEASCGQLCFVDTQGHAYDASPMTRPMVGYVPQGDTLFSGSIAENVRFANPTATDDEVWEALRLADADKFVRKLENGVDTKIGERAHGLSGGQSQRIGIARAIVRHAPIIIFDEATSALDSATERRIFEYLSQVTPHPTCLCVTHRNSVFEYSDRVLEVRENRVYDVTQLHKH